MTGSFHPMQIMPFILWGGLIFAILQLTRTLPNLRSREFGFSALVLVAWLCIFSLMSGFSIGMLTAMINVILGVAMVALAAHYRPQILFATTTSLMLVLFLRGWFYPAFYMLQATTVIALIFSITRLLKFGSHKNNHEGFAEACLAILGLVFFLSLLVQDVRVLLLFSAASSVIFGFISVILSKYHRGYLTFLTITSVVWAANLYWHIILGG